MGHAYAHLWNLPTTMFRFFHGLWGPWGRPDLAFSKFVHAILEDKPIDIYNHGDMYRDFTYVDDLVRAIVHLIDVVPKMSNGSTLETNERDSISSVAPFRIVNIGNSDKVRLLDFIDEIEKCLDKSHKKLHANANGRCSCD